MSAAAAEKAVVPSDLYVLLTGERAERYGALPVIPLPGDDERLLEFVRAMGARLAAGAEIYRRGPVIHFPDQATRQLVTMKPEAFCSWSQDYVETVKIKHDKNGDPYEVHGDMSKDLALKVLEGPAFKEAIPEAQEIRPVPVPVRRDDGKVVLADAGFRGGVYTFPFAGGYEEMCLSEAVEFIHELLREFPFDDVQEVQAADVDGGSGVVLRQSRSLAVQVAAMVAPFCVSLIPEEASRMGFVFDANSQRSGKTLLAKIALAPMYGTIKLQSWKSNGEELSKVIDAEMLSGSNYICFDNVRGSIVSQAIEGLMTSPKWTGRVLGKTEMFTVRNRVSLYFTGNGAILNSDMAHRCLVCRLFVPEGDVQERKVERVIDDPWLDDLGNRRRILSALWAIVRAWHEAGEPNASHYGFKPRLGFERWGEIIGGIVGFAGFGNPLENELSVDREMGHVLELIAGLRRRALGDNSGEFTSREVIDLCHDEELFDWMLEGRVVDGSYKLTPKAASTFGLMLGRYAPHGAFRTYKVKDGDVQRAIRFGRKGNTQKLKRYVVEF